jgi:hypothetical protein
MEKKQRDFIFLLVLMILSFICMSPLSKLGVLSNQSLVTGAVIVIWYIFLYRVTSNFYANKKIRIAYATLLIFQVSFTIFVDRNGKDDEITSLILPASVAYTATLIGLSLVLYILLNEMFTKKHNLGYSLLIASNIYFMIPIIFTYIFMLAAVHNPSLVGIGSVGIDAMLLRCFDYSWYVVAGIDYPGKEIGDAIQSIGVLESISSNLFLVFVIGRLMSK